jgi:hypothetical protein
MKVNRSVVIFGGLYLMLILLLHFLDSSKREDKWDTPDQNEAEFEYYFMDNFLMSHFCTLLIIINSTIKKIYI